MNLKTFHRQHKDIYNAMDEIIKVISSDEIDAMKLARLINRLAGQLNIHLSSEDKFLYPRLLDDEKVSDMARSYIDEMGHILKEFTEYREKYNTKTKVLVDINKTVIETKSILKKIRKRMNKEEGELYLLIE